MNRAIRRTTFAAVQSGDERFRSAEELIDVGKRATGDQRHRAVERARERLQQVGELSVDDDAIGRGREFEQRAIDIEKQCATLVERSRGRTAVARSTLRIAREWRGIRRHRFSDAAGDGQGDTKPVALPHCGGVEQHPARPAVDVELADDAAHEPHPSATCNADAH